MTNREIDQLEVDAIAIGFMSSGRFDEAGKVLLEWKTTKEDKDEKVDRNTAETQSTEESV